MSELKTSEMTQPAPTLPFPITVCGIEELAGHSDRQVSHVLSIVDPDEPEPEAFGAYGEHAKLELRFHDIIGEAQGMRAPQLEDVERILAFGRDILEDPASIRHLLVHCHMGISRSTAAMTLLLAQAQPSLPARNVLAQVVNIRSKAWPNSRILGFGENLLERRGEFLEAAAEVYRAQLERRPEIREFFISVGRGHEIDMALGTQKS